MRTPFGAVSAASTTRIVLRFFNAGIAEIAEKIIRHGETGERRRTEQPGHSRDVRVWGRRPVAGARGERRARQHAPSDHEVFVFVCVSRPVRARRARPHSRQDRLKTLQPLPISVALLLRVKASLGFSVFSVFSVSDSAIAAISAFRFHYSRAAGKRVSLRTS
jgi:hypothetical protein